MTNERAKEVLQEQIDRYGQEYDAEGIEALEIAIKVLEQEPCDDYISREAAMEEFEQYGENRNSKMYIDTIMDILADLPSVTPKSETITDFADRCRECGKMRKGHWIYDKTFENWRCSKCNESPKTLGYVGTADFMAEHFKFCNHCGAKMVEPQESESDD